MGTKTLRVTQKPPKKGRFKDDVYGTIEQNAATGEVRVKWFFWNRVWDKENDSWGPFEWVTYRGIFSSRVGGYDKGPYLYSVHSFRSMKGALRHYHRTMKTADLIAARLVEHERSERDDWRFI